MKTYTEKEKEQIARDEVVDSQAVCYVPVPKELLEELLDNTIECYNNTAWCIDKGVLARYQNEIKQVKELLKST